MEKIEHSKRLEISRRQREFKHRYEAYLQRCKELGLPLIYDLDNIGHSSATTATLSSGKTVGFISAAMSTAGK